MTQITSPRVAAVVNPHQLQGQADQNGPSQPHAAQHGLLYMNNPVANDVLLHLTVAVRNNGYQCVQYLLKGGLLMPGPRISDLLLFERKYVLES